MEENELTEGKSSSYNEAILKMERIHNEQSIINQLRANMLLFNEQYGKYNYEIIMSSLTSLLMEIRGKLSPKEKEIASHLRNKLIEVCENKRIYYSYTVHTLRGAKTIPMFSNENWNEIKKIINEAEDFVRDGLEEHGLSSPNQEQEGEWE